MSLPAKWTTLATTVLMLLYLSEHALGQSSGQLRPPVGLPSDAVHFKGRWYRVFVEKGGWKRARDRCVMMGGRLAIVPDSPTQAFIKELASELPLWLGATDEKTDGVWLWIDGSPLTFRLWEEGQPNNGAREHFLMISRNGAWHDAFESEPGVLGFVCEWTRK